MGAVRRAEEEAEAELYWATSVSRPLEIPARAFEAALPPVLTAAAAPPVVEEAELAVGSPRRLLGSRSSRSCAASAGTGLRRGRCLQGCT